MKLFLPRGASAVARERMAHLDCGAAKWRLYELDEREGEATEVEVNDGGNLATRLLHCPDQEAARRRFAETVARVAAVAPEAEAVVVSPAEISTQLSPVRPFGQRQYMCASLPPSQSHSG